MYLSAAVLACKPPILLITLAKTCCSISYISVMHTSQVAYETFSFSKREHPASTISHVTGTKTITALAKTATTTTHLTTTMIRQSTQLSIKIKYDKERCLTRSLCRDTLLPLLFPQKEIETTPQIAYTLIPSRIYIGTIYAASSSTSTMEPVIKGASMIMVEQTLSCST